MKKNKCQYGYNAIDLISRNLVNSINSFIFLFLLILNAVAPNVLIVTVNYFPTSKYIVVFWILAWFLYGFRYFDRMRKETNNLWFSMFFGICTIISFVPMWIQMQYFVYQAPNPITVLMAVVFYIFSSYQMVVAILETAEEYIFRSLVFLIYSICLIGYTYFSLEITYSFLLEEILILGGHILGALQGKTESIVAVVKAIKSLDLESIVCLMIVLWEVMIISNIYKSISKDKTVG